MGINIFVMSFLLCLNQPCLNIKQPKMQYHFKESTIKIRIENCSKKNGFYYVGLERATDTGWTQVVSDLRNLRRNEIFVLYEIRGKASLFETLRMEDIPRMYLKEHLNRFRFVVYGSPKRDIACVSKAVSSDFNILK